MRIVIGLLLRKRLERIIFGVTEMKEEKFIVVSK